MIEKRKYPVITLHQPWAQWVINGDKTIETRTHNRFKTLASQRILIHSSQKYDDTGALGFYTMSECKPGVILGCVFVDKIQKLWYLDSEYANIDCKNTNRWGLYLKVIEKFKTPIPAKGSQGIWYYNYNGKH